MAKQKGGGASVARQTIIGKTASPHPFLSSRKQKGSVMTEKGGGALVAKQKGGGASVA